MFYVYGYMVYKKGLRACAWKHLDREILAKIAKICEPAHNLVS